MRPENERGYRRWLTREWSSRAARPWFGPGASRVGFVVGVVGLLALIGAVYLFMMGPATRDVAPGAIPGVAEVGVAPRETALEHAQKHLNPKYVCPMHAQIVSDKPGTCPICGMELVEVSSQSATGEVQVNATMQNALGVRTATVRRKTLYRRIDSVGYIKPDEKSIRSVSLRTDGWAERLVVKSVGERVKRGDLLAEIYSPTLVNAQEEYVQALDLKTDSLLRASEKRLLSLGISMEQINRLSRTRQVEHLVKVYAPQDGVIAELAIREGMFVQPSTPILSITNLATVWLVADIFERQASWVERGLRAKASLSFSPGKVWEGTVDYIYPSLDADTRSLRVRLRFDNPGELMKPNMYADVAIFADPLKDVLVVPREALIRTGEEERVILALGDGKFKPAVVHSGMETDEFVEISIGLKEGDEVVVSSQFLIDSESNLRATLNRMGE